jgi:hypothetical protein
MMEGGNMNPSLIGKTVGWARAHFEAICRTTLGGMAFVDGR